MKPYAPSFQDPEGDMDEDLHINDVIAEMQDTSKTVYVELLNDYNLTVIVNGYTYFSGDIANLQGYNAESRKRLLDVVTHIENGWECTRKYTIEGIGTSTPPRKMHHEKYLRW